jgi:hypothetical protein
MKDYLVNLVRSSRDPIRGHNLAREYLQALILSSLQRVGAMIPLAFHGGTALRFLYGSQRYSEDLDFALEGNRENYDFRTYLKSIRSDLETQRYEVALKINDQKVVHSAFVSFPGLPYELNLSPNVDERLSIKLEVDTNTPTGAGLQISLVRRHVVLRLQHHDQASLLAGKLHAILQRPFLKGRDLYDLIWYLSDPDWSKPNMTLLNNALEQTGWNAEPLTSDTWRQVVGKRLDTADWDTIVMDVRPFLEPDDRLIELLNQDTLSQVLDL